VVTPAVLKIGPPIAGSPAQPPAKAWLSSNWIYRDISAVRAGSNIPVTMFPQEDFIYAL